MKILNDIKNLDLTNKIKNLNLVQNIKKQNIIRDVRLLTLLSCISVKETVLKKGFILNLLIVYTILAVILDQFLKNYTSNTGEFFTSVLVPFFSSYNLLITIVFTFLFNEQNYKFHLQENSVLFNFSSIKKHKVAIIQYVTGAMLALFLAIPCVLILTTLTGFGVELNRNMFFPLISTFFLHQIISSVIIFSQFILRKKFISLFSALMIITISSVLLEFAKITPNFFVANLLERISFAMRLQDMFIGAIKISDLLYFVSFPISITLILKYFFQHEIIRSKKSQAKNLLGTIFLLFSIILLNYVAEIKTGIIDLTHERKHSLEIESAKQLKDISKIINVYTFYTQKSKRSLLKTFDLIKLENPLVNVTFIDPDQRPDLIKKYRINKLPAIVSVGEIINTTYSINEWNIVRSISSTFNSGSKSVAIYDPNGLNKRKLSIFIQKLTANYYETRFIQNLDGYVSKLNERLIILADKDLNEAERNIINDQIDYGVDLYLLLAPNFKNSMQSWRNLLSQFGVDFSEHFVVDKENYVTGSMGTVPQVSVSNSDFDGRVIFPLSPAFNKIKHANHIKTEFILVSSAENSWGEASIGEISTSLKRNENDIEGPVGLHMRSLIYEKSKVKTRINMIGSTEFLSDKYANYSDNGDYIFNHLNKPIEEKMAQKVNLTMAGPLRGKISRANNLSRKFIYLIPFSLIALFFFLWRRDV